MLLLLQGKKYLYFAKDELKKIAGFLRGKFPASFHLVKPAKQNNQ